MQLQCPQILDYQTVSNAVAKLKQLGILDYPFEAPQSTHIAADIFGIPTRRWQ